MAKRRERKRRDEQAEEVYVELGPGAAVLLDELGAKAIRLDATNSDDTPVGLLLELGGRLNKSDQHVRTKYLLNIGQGAELLANIIVAAQQAGDDPTGDKFRVELDDAIDREQDRTRATMEEHQ